ncbi:hypothetical protein [Nocardioides jishulii]|uniref:PH domain-containing protein n=1 Tax=Nocardioides jishulii TaxID=2575440 RepID=A0A4U2YS25_9ACTN|nr:hypothetical protein [Nocardioides jishulii]QCX28856.1 hypothetical protein FCL41_15990 [Nocardioides jishulii]TKI64247.1 hypothetical protein FC770_03575 [Nocardioides jishulii]
MSDYRFSPALTARLLGLTMLLMAVVVALVTLGVAVANWHSSVLLVPCIVVIVVVLALMAWTNGWVVRLSDEGYQVRRIRSVGVPAARWKDVEDAVTSERLGSPVLILRLRDGGTTTIPVAALHVDREAFANAVADHLNRGHGIRPLGG